ncbi:anti-sigma factor [Azohydromonas australica]|uniref:anti-sigma factor n=1 Tax=Azohydromonas australica TaxID=364039 RepID=UPI00040D1A81|nr:anti-sigma factor [Azohydromonas australica]
MDYSRPALSDRLAAEYVLGTLRGPARRRFEALLPAHPALRTAVAFWQAALVPMAERVAPQSPSPQVWARIEQRLFPDAVPAPASPPWWRRLGLWQGLAGSALVAALALGLALMQPPAQQPPIVVVLDPNPQAGGALQARFVASLSADGRALVLRPIGPVSLASGRALELWAVPDSGAPRSLGLVSPQQGATVQQPRLLQGTAAFAVSVEPAGGSPTGAPTGPIVSLGLVRL